MYTSMTGYIPVYFYYEFYRKITPRRTLIGRSLDNWHIHVLPLLVSIVDGLVNQSDNNRLVAFTVKLINKTY